MSKLTLSVDKAVVSRAKRYAKQKDVSISELVETYLDLVTEPRTGKQLPPLLRSIRGSLKKVNPEEYRRHLAKKYR